MAAGVAAACALVFNGYTLREMRRQRELSIRSYLLFDHGSPRRRANALWQQLGENHVPDAQRRQQVIAVLQQDYDVKVRNVGNGPAIGCFLYAYCPQFEQNGSVSMRFFRTDWFSLGSSTGPDDHWVGTAFNMRKEDWVQDLPEEAQKKLEQPWERSIPAQGEHWTREDLMVYLRDNSDEVFTYFDQFGQHFMRSRRSTVPIILKLRGTMPEMRQ